MTSIIVVGGAGFIGVNFVRSLIEGGTHGVVVVDKLTYAGMRESLAGLPADRVDFHEADMGDRERMTAIFRDTRPGAVVNFAAETHVDRSIDGPHAFVETNVVAATRLFDVARSYWMELGDAERNAFRFLQVSTDEVYGALGAEGVFTEETAFAPNSPYAASKAAADHFARAYHRTYGFPVLVSHCSNNYGPYQFPEKLIPLVILNAIEGKRLPVYGDGLQVRDWLHVRDHCDALRRLLDAGVPGERYNIGGANEMVNIDVVRAVCRILDHVRPAAANPAWRGAGARYEDLIEMVSDRPGHDRRYAVDAGKIQRHLGWVPQRPFSAGLEETVRWYLDNQAWCRAAAERYQRQRLGLAVSDTPAT